MRNIVEIYNRIPNKSSARRNYMKKAIVVIIVLCFFMTGFADTVFAQANNAKTPPLSMQILEKKSKHSKPPYY